MDAGASLDFIGDERIRKSLTRDLEELDRAFEFRLWKSTHVIAGSVIEAILIDGLLNTGGINMTVENILKLDLGSAIKLCKEHKIVSERSEQLSTVIKDYRNLIHPGRVIRLEESVEENTA
ncbi:MAG TPA: hypothetical protein VNL71_06790, partial [Chloroflexota bacterium]|nr:hypothetical protein [Chloroflexota bacterium]